MIEFEQGRREEREEMVTVYIDKDRLLELLDVEERGMLFGKISESATIKEVKEYDKMTLEIVIE